ncbi:hypothetical protein RAJCM14343_5869 [Rhodococcus aetherivorans]|uniref:Uncharacterized protein n=1 Tax=Rhodococcus aetherivorans TaxID=191292 RepID=A0ABQ0YVA8_9NOCA|nr:hypothetical protein RAJCM14343_5869 [Rhodococcus aetherivorans]
MWRSSHWREARQSVGYAPGDIAGASPGCRRDRLSGDTHGFIAHTQPPARTGHGDADGLPHHPRVPSRVPDCRRGACAAADPRDRRQLLDLAGGHPAPGPQVHGHRTGPARPRPLRQAPQRLLGRRVRQRCA